MRLTNAFKLNSFHLKLIAACFMLVDHIAYFLIPQTEPIYWIMRIIGRISAPLFWFCFVEGYKHTSNRTKYALRLLVSAIVMMAGNALVCALIKQDERINFTTTAPNMFLSLFFLCIVVELFEQLKKSRQCGERIGRLLLVLIFCLIIGFHAEYGWYVLFSVLCLYFINGDSWKYIAFVAINVLICVVNRSFIQVFMILAVLFMMMYGNEKPKRGMKWFFYIFYPVHLWILLFLSNIL